MQSVLFLEPEVKQLRAANEYQKRKRNITKPSIAAGCILTEVEGQQHSQEAANLMGDGVDDDSARPRKRASLRCSNSHQVGHIRSICSTI